MQIITLELHPERVFVIKTEDPSIYMAPFGPVSQRNQPHQFLLFLRDVKLGIMTDIYDRARGLNDETVWHITQLFVSDYPKYTIREPESSHKFLVCFRSIEEQEFALQWTYNILTRYNGKTGICTETVAKVIYSEQLLRQIENNELVIDLSVEN